MNEMFTITFVVARAMELLIVNLGRKIYYKKREGNKWEG